MSESKKVMGFTKVATVKLVKIKLIKSLTIQSTKIGFGLSKRKLKG